MTDAERIEPGLIADGWKRGHDGAFISLVGPIYFRFRDNKPEFCFRVQPKHDNTTGRPHGGMLMTFMDEALGWATHIARPGDAFFTVGFECKFIGASAIGDLVVAETGIVSQTKSLMFMRADCKVGDRIIASATGIWKSVKRS